VVLVAGDGTAVLVAGAGTAVVPIAGAGAAAGTEQQAARLQGLVAEQLRSRERAAPPAWPKVQQLQRCQHQPCRRH
jgi:hypothetical protein